MIAIGPLRNAALLAKQAASVDALSGGPPHAGPRRRRAARRLRDRRRRPPRPRPAPVRAARGAARRRRPRRPARPAAARRRQRSAPPSRAWRATPTATRTTAARRARSPARRPSARAAWSDLGRPGRPLLWGQGYFALGDEDAGAAYLRDYYAFTGPFAEKIAAGNLTSAARDPRLRARLRGGRLRRADPLPHRRRPRSARPARRGAGVRVSDHRRRPGRPLPGDPAEEGRPHPRRRRHRAQRARRHVRLGRRVLRGDARRAARRRPREPPADHRHVRALARDRHPLPRAACCARAATPSRPSRASCSCTSSSARARELGVELRFDTEVTDLAEPDADLVVGADGVNSLVRRTYAADFGERVAPQGCKYVWFGTDLVLDAFTFIFKETEAGLVQVHAYPFDEHTSTWIVECPEHTWRAAGLRRDGRGRVAAGLRGAVRRGAAGPPPDDQPLAVDELPARPQRELAPRQRRAARRRRPHRALLDRLGHEARDGGRDRARAGVPAPPARPRARARRLRARAPARRRALPAGRRRERRLLLARGALRAHGPDAVRVQPAHAQRPRHPREPRAARPAVRPRARRVVPRRRRRARSRRRRCSRRGAACATASCARPPSPSACPSSRAPAPGLVLAGPVAATPDGRISPDTPTLHDDESPPRGAASWTRCTRAARTRACCSPTPGAAARPARAPAAPTCRCARAAGRWSRPRRSPTRRACRRRARWTPTTMARVSRRLRRGGRAAPPAPGSTCSSSTWATATCSRRSSRPSRTGATTSTAATSTAACASRCRCSTRCARRGRRIACSRCG